MTKNLILSSGARIKPIRRKASLLTIRPEAIFSTERPQKAEKHAVAARKRPNSRYLFMVRLLSDAAQPQKNTVLGEMRQDRNEDVPVEDDIEQDKDAAAEQFLDK